MTDHPTRPLTERQSQVAELVAAGLTRREIARRLDCSPQTVKVHVREIAAKLPGAERLWYRCAMWLHARTRGEEAA
jgi:DNA-binding NarL/FixJ family response regulator